MLTKLNRIYVIENGLPAPVIAVDQEGGNVIRIPWLDYNPSNAFLGLVDDLRLSRFVGLRTGDQLSNLGIKWNLAPVLDISNHSNPVILERSFSSNAESVALHGDAYIEGLQLAGITATAKHFPGHGGVIQDSHVELPRDNRPLSILEIDMFPFKKAVERGVRAIMMSHVLFESIDPDFPSSLSKKMYQILRRRMRYQNLILTDSVDMQALAKNYTNKEIARFASRAGADIIESVDLDRALELSENLAIMDEKKSAERIKNVTPVHAIAYTPPPEIIQSLILSNVKVIHDFQRLNPDRAADLIFLDEVNESKVSSLFSKNKAVLIRLNELNFKIRARTLDEASHTDFNEDQLIIVGRNEHLKTRSNLISRLTKHKHAVFISTGVPYDSSLIPQSVGYISAMSSRKEAVLGSIYKAFGFL